MSFQGEPIRMRCGKKSRQRAGAAIKIFVLLSMLFLACTVRYAFAGIHPIQLDQYSNDAKCAECHSDKAEGKNVHPAVAMGCLNCHLIRNSGDTTRVNLKTARAATLCFECHRDKQGTENPRQVHAPAVQDCLKCHDPHNSPNANLLLKPTSGGKGENLCLDCHDEGENVPLRGSRHAAIDSGCDACHVTHKIGKGTSGEQEFDFHLAKAVPNLCLGCHDAKDPALIKAHQGQPFGTSQCIGCHDPHASKSAKLAQKYLHAPFESGSCDSCHQAAKDGKVVLNAASAKQLCQTCHPDKGEEIEKAKVQHPGAAGECTDCHGPHGGKYPRFLRPDPVAVCEGCHSDVKDIHENKNVLHQSVFKQACSVCHMPHGGDREHLLRAGTNVLCLTCHGAKAKGEKVADSGEMTIFGGTVALPDNYLNQVEQLLLDGKGLGHPVPQHPVSGVLDPSDPQKTKMMTCVSCHTPHGGGKALLVTGMDTTGSLCMRCHENVQDIPREPGQTAQPGVKVRRKQ